MTFIADSPKMKTGSYEGDGALSKAITGIGFQPRYLTINLRHTVDGQPSSTFVTTEEIVDDAAEGMAITHREGATPPHASRTNAVKSLDADGFTVGDNSANEHPNKIGSVYNYRAMG